MKPTSRPGDAVISTVIKICGYSSILFVGLILFFLLREGLPALWTVDFKSLTQPRWYPIEGYFGLLPLILGTLLVTITATLIALPFGLGTAIFLSEVAPNWIKVILKPIIEILAGIPSVVLGFIGILVMVPFLRKFLDLPTGLTAFTGAILLGLISIPTIVSVAEEALNTVPAGYRQAGLALGATKWQTIWGVTVPAAKTGILTAVMLGVGRSLGETMAVMMVTGNAAVLPVQLDSLFRPVRTMTATIASEMGEVATGSAHYEVLFLIGIILFLLSLVINIVASYFSTKQRKRTERILS
jgi:phosphate transport system permease protein